MLAGVAAVAVMVAAGGVWRLWQQDYFWRNPLANATVERLTDFEGEEMDAAISPDGKFTVFLSDRDGRMDAWVSQIGGAFVNITKGQFPITADGTNRRVGFSGDGAQVWFCCNTPGQSMSWLAPAIGGAPRPFIEGGVNPIWSPDGRNITYYTADPAMPSSLRTGMEAIPAGIRGTAGNARPLSDVVARWSLRLLREGHSPDGRNGYLAHLRKPRATPPRRRSESPLTTHEWHIPRGSMHVRSSIRPRQKKVQASGCMPSMSNVASRTG